MTDLIKKAPFRGLTDAYARGIFSFFFHPGLHLTPSLHIKIISLSVTICQPYSPGMTVDLSHPPPLSVTIRHIRHRFYPSYPSFDLAIRHSYSRGIINLNPHLRDYRA